MDYQIMTDFIISNTDEHLMNFGVLRDADTMQFIGPAPIFDSGNSMFFKDDWTIPYSRAGLLERPITSFYKTEDKILAKVRDRKVVKLDLLPSPAEVKDFYMRAGKIYQGVESLFTVSDAIRASSFILDKKQVTYSLPKAPGYEQSVTIISANNNK